MKTQIKKTLFDVICTAMICSFLFCSCKNEDNNGNDDGNTLSEFALAAPINDAANVGILPHFMWYPSVNAESYTLYLADNENFVNAKEYANILGINFTPAAALNHETKYYWKVTAADEENNHTRTSPVFSFTTVIDLEGVVWPVLNVNHTSYLTGAYVEGTYVTDVSATSVKLYRSETDNFAARQEVATLSGGSFSIPKNQIAAGGGFLMVVSTVRGVELESNAESIYIGEALQVHDFMSVDGNIGTTNASRITVDVDNGTWVINYEENENWNGYGRIWLSSVLDNNEKSISSIKGVYYKYRSVNDVNQMVTYIRENTNPVLFNISNIVGTGSEEIWSDVFQPLDCSGLDNNIDGRRLSIGLTNIGKPAGTLYVRDLYIVF